jgi:catechol 2,3-dioxygenase-like lactoylglutathione lyase family enzyme
MAAFPGISHVALTVTDLAASAPWYDRLLGSRTAGSSTPPRSLMPNPVGSRRR